MPTLQHLLEHIRGSTIERDLRPYQSILAVINTHVHRLADESDEQLRARAALISQQIQDDMLAPGDVRSEFFALVSEISQRTLGMRPFHVQMITAIALHQGKIAEMQTGEGKTLAAVAPVALHALQGHGVHVLTFNDYLSGRDAEWMGPVYRFLGLSVGTIKAGMSPQQRRAAYACDITYATAKEAGFDFLRDQLVRHPEERVHRGFAFALVDEADSILIDEARIPLVIAGAVDGDHSDAGLIAHLVKSLESGTHFDTDEYERNVHLSEEGLSHVEQFLGCGPLHDPENLHRLTLLNLALHARALLHADVDYIVRDGRIDIIDELTGRVVEDRHWPDGLQAAVEAKESVQGRADGSILGSITLQHFLEQYEHVCGMTATACPAADELAELYDLPVVVVPPNRHCVRRDEADLVFTHQEAKHHALVRQIQTWHDARRPVLVGTASVAESDQLGELLRAAGIRCQVLNARNDAIEAELIADAGAPGAVTISTNMAGRGTDIRLGGHDESQREVVVASGGLCVIGTNRHESRRIDDQLRGRAGRQGDPGSSRFYISLQDPLIVRHGIDALIPDRFRPALQADPFDHPVVRREIDRAQRIVEGQSFDIRRTLFRYSQFVEDQRRLLFERRERVFLGQGGQLRQLEPVLYASCCQTVSADMVDEMERIITLHHIDGAWREYLAQIAALRDGIHLVGLGGLSPVDEFHKEAGLLYDAAVGGIGAAMIDTFRTVQITADGMDLDREGLRGPSSTWTYLVNDDSMVDHLANQLIGNRNMGMNVGAGLMWPLLGLLIAARKLTQKKR
ncbi:MAG: accessory Sec system translocase SecA2 [Gemmatimonadetes bacterium]|nr:accessory Sec system translocase SecA2 [Gemmatimonadota bacterium]MBT5060201.1 accessory Sec system translocase SecA2 [Gemmatimonadota bacterium]MBT5146454.1 accessory Sec system translocase SecA2 [Gemmatimonadota bacterium]MBT5591375.1 accessory Sec system translocase SecA2 [Gemmatimonadota bacterium]MBT5962170.1 accessory Sec system translocase SecA2 [Gemmatimonadota bacterium]